MFFIIDPMLPDTIHNDQKPHDNNDNYFKLSPNGDMNIMLLCDPPKPRYVQYKNQFIYFDNQDR